MQFRYFHAVAIVQNGLGMSLNSLLGVGTLFSKSWIIACLFLSRTDLIFETRKRAFRIKFGE